MSTRAERQMDVVWKACNAATTAAMRSAPSGTAAKADAYMAATVRVADLLAALEAVDQRHKTTKTPPAPTR